MSAAVLRAVMENSPKFQGYTAGLSLMGVAKAGPVELDDLTDAEMQEIVDWLGNDVLDPPKRIIEWERRVGSFAAGRHVTTDDKPAPSEADQALAELVKRLDDMDRETLKNIENRYEVPAEQSYEATVTMTITPAGEKFFREHKTAPHQAPWRWQPRTGNLEDANGNAVLWAMSTNSEDGVIGTDSDVVLALLAAAPEMEALLREELEVGRRACPSAGAAIAGDSDAVVVACGKCRRCRIVWVLSRIDAAADAGKAKGG